MRNITLIALLLLLGSGVTWAQSSRKELERQRKATMARIAETSKLLKSTQADALSNLNRLQVLNEEIKDRESLIETMNKSVLVIQKEQSQVKKEIVEIISDIELKKGKYAQAMRSLYHNQHTLNTLLFVLSADNFLQSYRRLRYVQAYGNWRKDQAESLKGQQKSLSTKQRLLEQKHQEQLALLEESKKESMMLVEKQKQQKELVASLQSQKSSLSLALKKQQSQARVLDQKIEQIIAEEARIAREKQREQERLAAEKAKANPSTNKGKTTTPSSSIPSYGTERALSSSFEKNKGRLPYPVKGSAVITTRFGKQKHAELAYVTTQSNGITLQGSPGLEAQAICEGVVSRVFILPGYNSSIIVRHGSYMTVYSNLNEVYVKAGDRVKPYEKIGKVFTDHANRNLTQMQFQVWKDMTKLNPELWIKR